ncbi:MAG: hypothetical protein Q7S56_01980 [Nanoarchaeota archaeon]|nr:hypothetical protein [Nanoarchaeota archaeon]
MNKKFIFLTIFLYGILLFNFVSGYTSSYVQYSQPDAFNYLNSQGLNVGQYSNIRCDANGADFILQIAPLGCTPMVVRSDLLEEENVPVFCPIVATKINPLIDVKAIEHMDIGFSSGTQRPAAISGIGFYPARAALSYSSGTLLNSPVLSNVGYAVIVLKQQQNESAMPDFVEGNLTATIRYDIQKAFGIGQSQYVLPVLSESDWNNNFVGYGFWNGRGYLRVNDVTNNDATISVYADKTQRTYSVTLQKGASSGQIAIPGFYCNAYMRVHLDDIQNPGTIAKVEINGNVFDLSEGQSFAENRCQAYNVLKQGLNKRVSVRCTTDSGSQSFDLITSPSVKLDVGGNPIVKNVGELVHSINGQNAYLVYTGSYSKDASGKPNLDSMNTGDLYVYLYETTNSNLEASTLSTITNTINSKFRAGDISSFSILGGEVVPFGAAQTVDPKIKLSTSVFGSDLKVVGYSTGVNKFDFSNKQGSNFFKALSDYNRIVSSYGSVNNGGVTYGESSLFAAIKLAFGVHEYSKATELCGRFVQLYSTSPLLVQVQNQCGDTLALSNGAASSKTLLINGVATTIGLNDVVEPSPNDYSANILFGSESVQLGKEQKHEDSSSGEFIQLVNLDDNTATVSVKAVSTIKDDKAGFASNQNLILQKNKAVAVGDKTIILTGINLHKVAKVSLIPEINNVNSQANFSFKLGIEKRAIQLAPDQIQSKINNLNQSIAKWEGISKNLGTVVTGFKAACLTTGAFLTVSNFISNTGGKAIARQNVMTGPGGWNSKCQQLFSQKKYSSVSTCLLENNDEINTDVDKLSQIITEYSKNPVTDSNAGTQLQQIASGLPAVITDPNNQNNNIDVAEVKSVFTQKGYSDGQVQLSEARDISTWNAVLANNPSPELEQIAKANLYSTLKTIQTRSETYTKITNSVSEAAGKGINGLNFNVFVDKDLKPGVYNGAVAGANSYGIISGTPVAGAIVSSGEYIVSLKDAGNGNYVPDNVYDLAGGAASDENTKLVKSRYPVFVKYDSSSYNNKFIDAQVKYFETAPYKGMPAQVPFDLSNGWYTYTKQTLPGALANIAGVGGATATYDQSGAPASFLLCNVGANGRAQADSGFGDDTCTEFNPGTGAIYGSFPGLTEGQTQSLVRQAINAITQASRQYKAGVTQVVINGQTIKVGNPATNVPDIECTDFMSPANCNLLFNVCDPVICPSSRCDLGGSYHVDNVIQSGIIGSVALCLPNFPEVKVPICLTGVKAGVDDLISVMKDYQMCLQDNLDTGRTVGICDEINSIYMCEFLWRQSIPVANLLVPKLLEVVSGKTSHGGGEYLGIQSAWTNAQNSIDYMVNYYGAQSYKAFQARSTNEVGSTVCKAFASANYPNSGKFLDNLLAPDSPNQYQGWFSEIPYTTATVPSTSQYKVFYHIYSGNDQGAYFQVYLKAPVGSSYYQTNQLLVVDSGYIKRGGSASETKDILAPTGYQQMCISVNGKDDCGFQKVTTSFALNYLNDQYLKEQATQTVKTEQECVSGTPSVYSLVQPNVQEGANQVLNPQLYNQGIVRVCSTSSPGKGTDPLDGGANARWVQVGSCGTAGLNCYIDTQSVKQAIKGIGIENDTLQGLSSSVINALGQTSSFDINMELNKINAMSPAEKISYITENLISQSLLDTNKVQILFLRAVAYGILATQDFEDENNKAISQQTILSTNQVGGGVSTTGSGTFSDPFVGLTNENKQSIANIIVSSQSLGIGDFYFSATSGSTSYHFYYDGVWKVDDGENLKDIPVTSNTFSSSVTNSDLLGVVDMIVNSQTSGTTTETGTSGGVTATTSSFDSINLNYDVLSSDSQNVRISTSNSDVESALTSYVIEVTGKYNVNANFVRALITQESDWNPASTPDIGLMQLTPAKEDGMLSDFVNLNTHSIDGICVPSCSADLSNIGYSTLSTSRAQLLSQFASTTDINGIANRRNILVGTCYVSCLRSNYQITNPRILALAYNVGPSVVVSNCKVGGTFINYDQCVQNLNGKVKEEKLIRAKSTHVPNVIKYYNEYSSSATNSVTQIV